MGGNDLVPGVKEEFRIQKLSELTCNICDNVYTLLSS
jgi:hypothetical protein